MGYSPKRGHRKHVGALAKCSSISVVTVAGQGQLPTWLLGLSPGAAGMLGKATLSGVVLVRKTGAQAHGHGCALVCLRKQPKSGSIIQKDLL